MAEQKKHPILLVDDEPEILYSLQGLLRRDFEVHTAQSGAEAMEILHQQPVHVVMTDQRMPEMTGVELLSRARGECPEAIRIVFTGYADIKAVVDAINQGGIYRYITKPWDPDELLDVLREAADYYEQTAERKRLLHELYAYTNQALELVRGLQANCGEKAAPQNQEVDQFIQASGNLTERLDWLLGKEEQAGR